MQKSSGIFSTVSNLVNNLGNNPLVKAENYIINPLSHLVHFDKGKHTLEVNKALKIPYGDVLKSVSGGKIPSSIPIPGQVGDVISRGTQLFNQLPQGQREQVGKYWGKYKKGMGWLGKAQWASQIGQMVEGPVKHQIAAHRAHKQSQPPALPPIARMRFNPVSRSTPSTKLDRRDPFYRQGFFGTIDRIMKSKKYWPEANALTGMTKPASAPLMRRAEDVEIPYLYDICVNHRKEFVMNTENSYKLAADRLLNQDTYIAGDLRSLKGFVNGGYRDIPNYKTASLPYYLRFVYVNPEHAGQGLAGRMMEDVLSKHASDSGAWTMISESNKRMQKVAAKLGFQLLYNLDNSGETTGVWYRR
jgi:GNAT superfamily N-acetyltransferase